MAFGVVLPVIGLIVLAGLRATRADDRQRWMISGKVVVGLSVDRSQSRVNRNDGEWIANVSETSWQFIVIHHSAGDNGSVSAIDKEHRQRKDASGNPWLGIGYHFVIGNGQGMKDGAVEATFRWNEQLHGAHSGDSMMNARGIGICLIGNFEKTPPTKAQMESVRKLVNVLAVRHRITRNNLMGHASVKATACPGKHFPLKELRRVIPESQS